MFDIVVISHGHYDHGRGIARFLRYNRKAIVYISKSAFKAKPYKIIKKVYIPIGIRKPLFSKRIVLIDEDLKIENGIKIYSDIPNKDQIIKDETLLMKTSSGYLPDDFEHEIYLSLYHSKARVLISGCSHKGIENIIDTIEEREKKKFNGVVGGFHFSHYDSSDLRQAMYLEQLADKYTSTKKVSFYAGHCTGDEAYIELKRNMKDSIHRIKTGTEFKI